MCSDGPALRDCPEHAFFVSADTAAVKSVKHSAAVTPHKHVKDQTVHVVADPFDGSNGQLALPTVRPDFVSIWDGRIVDVAGPTTRPGFLDIWPESTKELAGMVRQQTGQNVLSETKLTLNAGDTLAKVLLKAKFTEQDVAYVSKACQGT